MRYLFTYIDDRADTENWISPEVADRPAAVLSWETTEFGGRTKGQHVLAISPIRENAA